MGFKWYDPAWKVRGLLPAQKLTLLALVEHANNETGECWPSVARLAELVGQDVRTIQRHLDQLEKAGYLIRRARYRTDWSQASSKYRLKLQRGDGESVTPPARHQCHPHGHGCHAPLTPVSPLEPVIEPIKELVISNLSAVYFCEMEKSRSLSKYKHMKTIEKMRFVLPKPMRTTYRMHTKCKRWQPISGCLSSGNMS